MFFSYIVNINQLLDPELYKLTIKKSQKIAWFVSNCDAESKRDILAKKIQQHIPIDIYGKCGPLKCDPPTNTSDDNPCIKLIDNYKFYLSFENSLWQDYVTEKLFNVMANNFVIPIVYGGANYSQFVPPKSYINANDFVNVNDLVNYLQYLDEHPDEYIKYFWWLKHYRIVCQNEMTKFCELCVKLHEPNAMISHKFYHDIDGWWFRQAKKMKKPNIIF